MVRQSKKLRVLYGVSFWGVFLLVGTLLLPSVADAAPPRLKRYDSRHYRIHTNLPVKEVQRFGRHMDLIFDEYANRMRSIGNAPEGRQNLYLLNSQQDYQNQLATFGITGVNTAGMYFRTRKGHGLAAWVQGQSLGQVYHTLQHEGFHQFADSIFGPRIPIWVNEGLAEYFGEAIIVKDKVKTGILEEFKLEQLRDAIRNKTAIPFRDLLGLTHESWRANLQGDGPEGGLQYLQSWAVVHFLIHGDGNKYRAAFERYLQLLANGQTHDAAFGVAFGTNNPTGFEKRWRRFLAHAAPDHYSAAIQRMEFLAMGLQWLHENNAPMPKDLDALRSILQRSRFKVTYGGHGTRTVMSGTSGGVYGYRDRDGRWRAFRLESAGGGGLPVIAAPSLKPQAVIAWQERDGTMYPEVVFR